MEAGFLQIFLWEEVKNFRPQKLKVSPMAVVPNKNRPGRIVLDFSSPVYPGWDKNGADPIQSSFNETKDSLSPDMAVKEIGNDFQRLLHFIESVGTEEIFMLSKIDLFEGLWRILVEDDVKWSFAYVIPDPPDRQIRLVIPSLLQMGWE